MGDVSTVTNRCPNTGAEPTLKMLSILNIPHSPIYLQCNSSGTVEGMLLCQSSKQNANPREFLDVPPLGGHTTSFKWLFSLLWMANDYLWGGGRNNYYNYNINRKFL